MAQEVVALMIVALAALNLVRIWGGSLGSKGDKSDGCGKCGGCDSKAKPAPNAPQLVQLQVNLKSKGE